MDGEAFLDGAVIVPAVAARAMQHLHEANAAFHHAARQQTLPAEGLAQRIVETIELRGGLGLARQVHQLGRLALHARTRAQRRAMRASSSVVFWSFAAVASH